MTTNAATFDLLEQLAAQVHERSTVRPRCAILLGTGLGGLAKRIEAECTIPYGELKGMPVATVETHAGELILGHLDEVPVIAFSGRLHCYEGHPVADVVLPVRLARHLGAKVLVMGSAVGGLDPNYRVGSLVAITDHINLMGVNPLVGHNDERIGPRWPDMYDCYASELIELAERIALEQGVRLQRGVYAGVLGPNLETRAEYRMLRTLGADLVGMSTVPEAIAAVHCGLKVAAFGIVTDLCLADALEPADVQKIIAAANAAEPILSELVRALVVAAEGGE